MIIRNNVQALNTWGAQKQNNGNIQKTLEKLSSGLRINRAGDDAAGLAISEKMRGQIRGMAQASRNIQDAISLIQVAEGGMQEVHSLLQRGRELSVQAANGSYTDADREAIQREINQINNEIDRIGRTTEFNTIKLLDKESADPEKAALLALLEKEWIGNAEELIRDQYGLAADGVSLSIVLIEGEVGGVLASVSALTPPTGLGFNLELHIHMADYRAGNITDRIIAHEMVHAVFNRTVNVGYSTGIPTWFNEGAAEFIHGADERLAGELALLGGNTAANRNTIVNNGIDAWGSTSQDYAGAYAAVKYMHEEIVAAGGGGIRDILAYLNADTTTTLDEALTIASGEAFANLADFEARWVAEGEAFIAGLNLSDADTGAIGGGTDTSVVPDGPNAVENFVLILPVLGSSQPLSFHVGSNSGQTISVDLGKISSEALGTGTVNVVSDADQAISRFDSAINSVSTQRSKLGAIQNRLEHAKSIVMNNEENLTASESRIRDLDLAKEMMTMTKQNILQQASMAMMAQANQTPQGILQILR